jgi:hypothetical protein
MAAGAVGIYWAAYDLQSQRALGSVPSSVREFFMSDASVVVGILALVLLGLFVNRWWVLIVVPGIPLLAAAILQASDHVAPYHDAGTPMSGWELRLLLLGVPLAVGLALGRLARRGNLWPGSRPKTSALSSS